MSMQYRFQDITRKLSPKQISAELKLQKMLQAAMSELGLTYYGQVDYTDSSATLVRGMATHQSQKDSHYCFGSYGGYEVVFLRRQATLQAPDGSTRQQQWFIVQVDTKAGYPLPHIFFAPHGHRDVWYHAALDLQPEMQPLSLGSYWRYPALLNSRYTVYGSPAQQQLIEYLVRPDISMVLAQHYYPCCIEYDRNHIIISHDYAKITKESLVTMVKNAVWLALMTDAQYQAVREAQYTSPAQ